MRRSFFVPAAISLLFVLCAYPGFGLWKALKTESFTVFYPAGFELKARQALEIFEYYKGYAQKLAGSRGRLVAVVLQDLGTEGSGLADPIFRRIHLYLYAPSEDELGFAQNWWRLVGVHEYTHWLHLTSSSGLPAALVWVLGEALSPNFLSPGWLIEGLATHAESGISPFEGRLNDGTFTAYLATRTREGSFPSIVEATFAPPSFPGGTAPYLFGGEFIRYLAQAYGPESLARFVRSYGSSVLSYLSPVFPALGLDRTARQVFGKSFPALWADWRAHEAQRFKEFLLPRQAVTAPAWRVENPVFHEGRLYYQRSYPLRPGPLRREWRYELVELDPISGRQRILLHSLSAFSAGLRLRSGKLYYAVRQLKPGLANVELGSYGFASALYELDLASGRRRRVLTEELRAFEVLANSDIVFSRDRKEAFGSQILLWSKGKGKPQSLLSTEYLVREILVKGEWIFVSARRDWENFRIFQVDRQEEAPSGFRLAAISPFPLQAGGMSLAGDKLFFAATYEGSYAVYCYDLAERRLSRLTKNGYATSAAFDVEAGRLYFVSFHSEGQVLYRQELNLQEPGLSLPGGSADSQPSVASQTPPDISLPEGAVRTGGYGDNLLTLFPRLLYPLLEIDPASGSIQAGMGIMGETAIGDIQYLVEGSYDFALDAPAVEAQLRVLLPPVATSFSFSTLGASSLSATVEVPLHRSLTPGLTLLSLGVTGSLFDEGLSRRQLEPFLGFAFRGVFSELAGYLYLPLERVELGSLENRISLLTSLSLTRSFRSAGISAEAAGFYALDDSLWRLPAPRGYAAGPVGQAGVLLNLDFSFLFLRIRRGLWNPGIFLQDAFLVPFFDLALMQSLDPQWAAGAELHLELKALAVSTGWPLDLFFRLVVTREGQVSLSLHLESGWDFRRRRR